MFTAFRNTLTQWLKNGRKDRSVRVRGTANSVSLSLEGLEDRLVPANITWTGAGDTDNWSDADNWTKQMIPTVGDNVIFDSSHDDKSIFDLNLGGSLASLTFEADGKTGVLT